ncbi:MAG: hypothetical protein LBJ48_06070, partial [Coriobacteriales bacterium]|jgi:ribosomal 30S subunit maturation factor RimM|nr:hypothetical protein [Coriobacteriales bacterium]
VRHTAVTLAQDDFKKRGVLIRLEGVESRTQASRLTGRYLLACIEQAEAAVRRNSLEYDGESAGDSGESLEGKLFIDTAYGNLGCLDAIKTGPAYAIWVVDGPYGRLEIPAVDTYIVEDEPGQTTLSLPPGFIEITGTGHAD